MSLQNLSENAAFAHGAALWIVPQPELSRWTRKIDWYLNFQMTRASNHHAPIVEPGLVELLHEEHLGVPTTSSHARRWPLMLSCSHRLPAHQTVEVAYSGNASAWLAEIANIWLNLGRPTTRIFLPTQLSTEAAKIAWGDRDDNGLLSLVADSSGTN